MNYFLIKSDYFLHAGAGNNNKRPKKGRGKHLQRTLRIKKSAYSDTAKKYTETAGHLYFKKPKGFEGLSDDADITLTEVYTFELGRYGAVYNSCFKAIGSNRKADDGSGWYSAITNVMDESRRTILEIKRESLAKMEDPLDMGAVLDEYTDIMTDFPGDFDLDGISGDVAPV
jgi:hypothetical protein